MEGIGRERERRKRRKKKKKSQRDSTILVTKDIGTICCCHEEDPIPRLHPVHLRQQLVDHPRRGAAVRAVAAPAVCASSIKLAIKYKKYITQLSISCARRKDRQPEVKSIE